MNSKRIEMIKEQFKFKIYHEIQIFLKFVNFYKRFIYCYFKIVAPLTSLFKNSENEKKRIYLNDRMKSSRYFVSSKIFLCRFLFFTYYDFLKRNRVKTDVFNFVVANIFNQQNENDNWYLMTFWSRKMIFAK